MCGKKFVLPLALSIIVLSMVPGCGGADRQPTFSELISQAEKYDGKTVTLEAYYFTGFEITALAGSVGPSSSGAWRIVPTGTLIWTKGGVGNEIYDRMYVQTETPSGYAEHVGKLRVTGKFETGSKYGHLDAYQYLFTITSAELLEWSPPPAGTANEKDLPVTTTSHAAEPGFDLTAARKIAEDFILNSATFKFDGMPGSLSLSGSGPGMISACRTWSFTYKFETAHPGHGDRTGQALAQVITAHYAMILVNLENDTVWMASCDETWNMINDKELPAYVSGIVVGGGDTTPPGLMDAPRVFVYKVLRNEGLVNIKYTAYPPSPAGDAANAKITLDFYSGTIRTGDRIEARGTMYKETDTLVVAAEGDYIRTYAVKADVVGVVVNIAAPVTGGEKHYLYVLLRSDGTFINVRYTPGGSVALSLYGKSAKIGDYMRAVGAYDKNTNTVVAAAGGDLIKTYDHNPVIPGAALE